MMRVGTWLTMAALLAGWTLAAEPEWENLRKPEWSDAALPGRFNIAKDAVLSESGGLFHPLWSIECVAEPTPRTPKFDAKFHANTEWNAGWNSAAAGSVDPDQPFLRFDFPTDRPVKIDTLVFWSLSVDAPAYRPSFTVERRLGNAWETVFTPRCRRDEDAAFIRFREPFEADALRVRFLNPSPSSWLLMRRFWIYADAPLRGAFGGGKLEFSAPGLALTENGMVFPKGKTVNLECAFTPDSRNSDRKSRLTFLLTDYFRQPLPGTEKTFEIAENEARRFVLEYPGLDSGPYYLEARLDNGDSVLLRGRRLFGVAGCRPAPAELAELPAIPRPAFELDGGIGQNCGPGQRKSTDAIDAYSAIGANTIQLEMLWCDIEPLPGVYDFSDLDRVFLHAARRGKHVNISLYTTDGNMPSWLRQEKYNVLDQYGKPAWGRTDWLMLLVPPPSTHVPLYREHFRDVWKLIAERYTPSGRVLRFDLRPPLCERFYFDDFINDIRGADNVWDYSEWARRDFIRYLRDRRKLTLEEVSRRAGTRFDSWDAVQFPRPLSGYRAQQRDTRQFWLDFMEFKHKFHPADFFLDTVRAIAAVNSDAQIFLRYYDGRYDDLLAARRIAGGYFSMEHGEPYFTLRGEPPLPRCFEWGTPAPPYPRFNAGLLHILPALKGNALRWVYSPCLGEEKFNVPAYWKSWESLGRLSPHFAELAEYQLPPSEVALLGGFDVEFGKYETARPVRHPVSNDFYTSLMVRNNGGLYSVYWGAFPFNGLVPFEPLEKAADDPRIRLILDGGNCECPLKEQQLLLRRVAEGARAVLWSNGCRLAGTAPTDLVPKALGVTGRLAGADPGMSEIEIALPGREPFRGKVYCVFPGIDVPGGKVAGRIGGKPAAWLIPYGKGEILYVNGLPRTVKISDWAPFMDQVIAWAGVRPLYRATVPGREYPLLPGYALERGDGARIFAVYNNSGEAVEGTAEYFHSLLPGRTYTFELLHKTEAGTELRSARQDGATARLAFRMQSQDMMIVKAQIAK